MDFTAMYREYFQTSHLNAADKARGYLTGLLMKSPRKNMERMEEYVQDYDYQNQQQFLSDSPWDHAKLMKRVGRDVDELLGGSESALLIDESGFRKKGVKSAGVARQWNGRDGKVDNCQVGVFAALSNSKGASLVDTRLYLPESWTSDDERCRLAKIPADKREYQAKTQMAWEMIEAAMENGLRFSSVNFDALYGSTPWLLRKVEDAGLLFFGDVRTNQQVFVEDPKPYLPRRKQKTGRKFTQLRPRSESVEIGDLFANASPEQWQRIKVREGTKGTITVTACRMRVWLWDGEEKKARQWWAVCYRDSPNGELKYFLSNAGEKASLAALIRKHAMRFWIERCFQDGKTSTGMGDYQARGWIAWHHHMALVMLAMLFMLRERIRYKVSVELLSCQDIIELLNVYIPRKDTTVEAVIKNINERHRKRRAAIESAKRRNRKGGT